MTIKIGKVIISFIIGLFSIFCLVPFIMVVSGSLSNESDIVQYGYTLFPKHIDLVSYKILFINAQRIFNGYKISVLVTILGTIGSVLVNTLAAYSVSRKYLRYRKVINAYILITLLFTGGMVPWYMVCIRYLHLGDKFIALIIPYLANGFNIFLLRNYIQSIPEELFESAKIDGAGEYRIFFRITVHLMIPAIATIGLFTSLGYWNDWWLGLMLINKSELQPLQLMLRTIVSNILFLRSSTNSAAIDQLSRGMPAEGIKMAVCVITIGPIVFLYPFLQRYFVKGIMIGAVKG